MTDIALFSEIMGFCSDERFVCTRDAQGSVSSVQVAENYHKDDPDITAFHHLASTGSDMRVLSDDDFAAVVYDYRKLAGLIETDPVFFDLSDERGMIYPHSQRARGFGIFGERNVTSQSDKRFMFYLQMALQVVANPLVDLTGEFDAPTASAVHTFQDATRVSMDAHVDLQGLWINRPIALELIDRLKPKAELLTRLQGHWKAMSDITTGVSQFRIIEAAKSGNSVLIEAEKTVIDVLVWLGYVNPDVNISTPEGVQMVTAALDKHFGEIRVIGPRTISAIREYVSETYLGSIPPRFSK